MRNLGILLKNNFNILVGRIKGKKNISSQRATILLIVGVLALYALYFFQSYTMVEGFALFHVEKMALFHACLTSLSVVLIFGMMRTTNMNKTSDSDLLLSLPIKKIDIILSKTLGYYLFDFAFTFLMLTPYLITYQILINFNATILFGGLLLTILLPLLSVGITYILSFVFSRIFNRFKSANLIKSIVLTLLLTLILILLLFKTSTYNPERITDMESFFADRFFANLLLQFIYTLQPLKILYVLLLTILPFVLGILCYCFTFGKSFLQYHSKKTNLKFGQNKGSLNLLLKKELTFYASTPGYILNTIIGPVLALTLSIYLCVAGLQELNSLLGGFLNTNNLPFMLSIILCALPSMASISASSISLEGKSFWILKSSPIKENTLFLSKALTHMIIYMPFLLLSGIIVSICFSFSLLQFILLILPCLFLCSSLAFGGVLINLKLPNFDWEDPTKVVKNSLATLVSMILALVLTAIPIALMLIFTSLSQTSITLITISVYAVIMLLFISILFTKGKKIFNKI